MRCKHEGCRRDRQVIDWCRSHYQQHRRRGFTTDLPADERQRPPGAPPSLDGLQRPDGWPERVWGRLERAS